MDEPFILDELIIKYPCGDFTRKFCWNVPQITEGSSVKDGYIVQHIIRSTEAPQSIYTEEEKYEEYNHEYWEAWPVKDNKVNLPFYGFHDCWATPRDKIDSYYAIMEVMKKHINQRKNSSGRITMQGIVYWAPSESELCNIVDTTFKTEEIKWAWELPAAKAVERPERFIPVYTHPTFCHGWNIDDSPDFEALRTRIEE